MIAGQSGVPLGGCTRSLTPLIAPHRTDLLPVTPLSSHPRKGSSVRGLPALRPRASADDGRDLAPKRASNGKPLPKKKGPAIFDRNFVRETLRTDKGVGLVLLAVVIGSVRTVAQAAVAVGEAVASQAKEYGSGASPSSSSSSSLAAASRQPAAAAGAATSGNAAPAAAVSGSSAQRSSAPAAVKTAKISQPEDKTKKPYYAPPKNPSAPISRAAGFQTMEQNMDQEPGGAWAAAAAVFGKKSSGPAKPASKPASSSRSTGAGSSAAPSSSSEKADPSGASSKQDRSPAPAKAASSSASGGGKATETGGAWSAAAATLGSSERYDPSGKSIKDQIAAPGKAASSADSSGGGKASDSGAAAKSGSSEKYDPSGKSIKDQISAPAASQAASSSGSKEAKAPDSGGAWSAAAATLGSSEKFQIGKSLKDQIAAPAKAASSSPSSKGSEPELGAAWSAAAATLSASSSGKADPSGKSIKDQIRIKDPLPDKPSETEVTSQKQAQPSTSAPSTGKEAFPDALSAAKAQSKLADTVSAAPSSEASRGAEQSRFSGSPSKQSAPASGNVPASDALRAAAEQSKLTGSAVGSSAPSTGGKAPASGSALRITDPLDEKPSPLEIISNKQTDIAAKERSSPTSPAQQEKERESQGLGGFLQKLTGRNFKGGTTQPTQKKDTTPFEAQRPVKEAAEVPSDTDELGRERAAAAATQTAAEGLQSFDKAVDKAAAEIGGDESPPSVASAPKAGTAAPVKEAGEKVKEAGDAKGGDWNSLEWRKGRHVAELTRPDFTPSAPTMGGPTGGSDLPPSGGGGSRGGGGGSDPGDADPSGDGSSPGSPSLLEVLLRALLGRTAASESKLTADHVWGTVILLAGMVAKEVSLHKQQLGERSYDPSYLPFPHIPQLSIGTGLSFGDDKHGHVP
ncbi:hypothetical protein WJX73_005636 [Symbiochloris irregularis]|uniref:Uncharacterized protein n=1 Tax=Symbiochloris irregularis TaxID=706552 RepID=A0AAW1PUV6_9CHLO